MRRILDLIRSALGGGELDYTGMGIRRAIVLLSVPMVLEMGMEALFAIVDAYFVSRLGVAATTTVGLTESMLVLVYSIAWGLGIGATAVVARRTGEKDMAGVRVAAGQALALAVLLGLLIASSTVFNAAGLLALMGAGPDVVASGTWYARIMLGSNLVILVLFGVNAVFRGRGLASMALWTLAIANGVNIILDPLFIRGFGPVPAMGVTGAALATTIGRSIGVVFQVYHLFRRGGPFAVRIPDLRPVRSVMVNMLKVSAGSVAQFLIASASWVFLVRIVAESGTDASAGYTIAIRIMIFTLLPAWGMANAAATLVGQNLGAQRPDRAERSAWLCGHYNMAFMSVIAVLFWTLSPWIVSFFSMSPEADGTAVSALRTISLGYVFYGYGMVLAQAFNGAGDSMTPTWMNLVCFWMIEIPLAWYLASVLGRGPGGVSVAIAVSESTLALLSIALFRRGGWKSVRV